MYVYCLLCEINDRLIRISIYCCKMYFDNETFERINFSLFVLLFRLGLGMDFTFFFAEPHIMEKGSAREYVSEF